MINKVFEASALSTNTRLNDQLEAILGPVEVAFAHDDERQEFDPSRITCIVYKGNIAEFEYNMIGKFLEHIEITADPIMKMALTIHARHFGFPKKYKDVAAADIKTIREALC